MTLPSLSNGTNSTSRRTSSRGLLTLGVVLAAVNLRTAVTSVSPLLSELEDGLQLSSGLAGVLTALPVLSFALLGSLTPRLTRRFGDHRVLTAALGLMTAGLLLRSMVHSAIAFLAFSVAALAGGAMGNVLLPVLVKRYFPDRIGRMTAAYTTALAVGTTVAAATTVPLARLGGGGKVNWRVGLGSWAVLSLVALVAWLLLRGGASTDGRTAAPAPRVLRSPTARALTIFFAAQALQAYVAFGWFAQFFRERAHVSAGTAGLLVAFLAALAIPVSIVIPPLAVRLPTQRPLVVAFVACYLVAYTGMLLAPGGAWIWALLAGIANGAFPLALVMINLRTRTAAGAAALSTAMQSIGYLLAGTGPLLVGVLRGVTGGWGWPFALLFADLLIVAVAGWFAGRPVLVEDELVDTG